MREIAQREEERAILLSFSKEIADIRNRVELYEVVVSRIKKIFGIGRFVIGKINEDQNTFCVFASDPAGNARHQPDYKTIISATYPINDLVFGTAIASEDPVLFDVELLCKEKEAPSYVDFWKRIGMHYVLVVVLRAGGKNIGFAVLNFEGYTNVDTKSTLLKGLCAQLAVKVSGILANEKIEQQLEQIRNYREQLEEEKIYLKEKIENSIDPAEIIGESPELKKVFRLIAQVAYTDTTVLLMGETGTGKELVARAIHSASPRKNKGMIKLNCAAIPANLIESELFGHERGSFTGAVERRIGKFELANNGTLFLDEIGELTLDVQAKLLRALQEKEVERIGGKTTIKTNVRIIAATNRDLDKLMEEGKFRSDLYYRLNIFPITIPPLRDRREDIPKLAMHFVLRYAKRAGKKIKTISNKVIQELMQYHWPGNIRELEHLVERSILLTTGDSINEIHLPMPRRDQSTGSEKEHTEIQTLAENEKAHILKVLKHVKGRIGGKGGAAELLGLPASTLNSRIKKLGIRREHIG